jgi:hypothetical protein
LADSVVSFGSSLSALSSSARLPAMGGKPFVETESAKLVMLAEGVDAA